MEAGREQEEIEARQRLALLLPELPEGDWSQAEFLPSNSNEVWRLGEFVLRVCWRGDRRRSRCETLIGEALPASLRHPQVLGSGVQDGLAWQLQRYAQGCVLASAWLDMTQAQLRPIVSQLAEMLKTLHGWSPPAAVSEALAEREGPQPEPFGNNLLPLPVVYAVELLAPASRLPFVDPALLQAVEHRLVRWLR